MFLTESVFSLEKNSGRSCQKGQRYQGQESSNPHTRTVCTTHQDGELTTSPSGREMVPQAWDVAAAHRKPRASPDAQVLNPQIL